jgi:hypothetical protein
MDATRESLQEHFRLLSDDELVAEFASGDLTQLAKEVAAAELRKRRIDPPTRASEPSETSDAGPMTDDLALVARYFTAAEAHMLKGRLELEGIPAIVTDDHMAQALPSTLMGGVRVLVAEPDFQRALAIARAVERRDFAVE